MQEVRMAFTVADPDARSTPEAPLNFPARQGSLTLAAGPHAAAALQPGRASPALCCPQHDGTTSPEAVMEYATRTRIEAPATRAWRLLSAVEDWPRWLPTVTRVDALDGTPLATGRRYHVVQPRLRPAVWTVTGIDPGRRFAWQARAPGLAMVADHVVEPHGDDTWVHLTYRFGGLLGPLLGRLYGRLTRDYLRQEAAALKHHAEHPGTVPAQGVPGTTSRLPPPP
jgi:uncharacterized membrane protein